MAVPLLGLGVDELVFSVVGEPKPYGSKSGFARNGRVIITEQNQGPKLEWRRAVIAAALEMLDGRAGFGRQPMELWQDFVFPRPKSARKVDYYKPVHPDGDKLERNVWDGLTAATVIGDDAVICEWHGRKRLSSGEPDDRPGVHLRLRPLD